MNIVILVGPYFPYATAVGICMSNIASKLSEKNNIKVIALKNHIANEGFEQIDNYDVYRVTTPNNDLRILLDHKALEKQSNILKINLFYQKVLNIFRIIWNKYGLNRQLMKQYLKKIEEINDIEKINILIPACVPFETVWASMIFKNKNKNVKFFPFLFDSYSQNIVLFRMKFLQYLKNTKAQNLEKQVINSADKVFYSDNWEEHFKVNYKKYNKLIYIEHPLMKEISGTSKRLLNKKKINFLYQGELNLKMRPVKQVLEFFNSYHIQNNDIKLHFMGFGNAYHKVTELALSNPSLIHDYGRVPKIIATEYMLDTDISILIGNTSSDILPSKVYELISLGKPIICFYYTDHDAPIRLLKKYPFVYFVNLVTKNGFNFEEFDIWLKSVENKSVDYKNIEEIFYDATPTYIVNEMLKYSEELRN